MMWSKLKQRVEARFADSLAGRVAVHTTHYRDRYHDEDGRTWITVDERDVANFPEQGTISYEWRLANQMRTAANATDWLNRE